MATIVKTLPVEVYYNNAYRRCANGGISERVETLYLICEDGWFERDYETEERLIKLVRANYGTGEYAHVRLVNPPKTEGMVGPMFSGNFVYSCDSRFPSRYPIPIHDRYETPEQYALLSH